MSKPAASVIVPVWPPKQQGRANIRTLVPTLDRAYRGAGTLELVFLLNGHDALLEDFLLSVREPKVIHVFPRNVGVAPAWNLGATLASGDAFVFANEDVIFGELALDALLKPLSDERVGVASPQVSSWDLNRMRPARTVRRDTVKVPYGYLFAVRATTWADIGGVSNELAPAFFEEVDLAARLHERQFTVAETDSADVEHESGVSSPTQARTKIVWVGGSATVSSIYHRNQRYMLATWSRQRWRAAAPIFWTRAGLSTARRVIQRQLRRRRES